MQARAEWLRDVIRGRCPGVALEVLALPGAYDYAALFDAFLEFVATARQTGAGLPALNVTGGTKLMAVAAQEVFSAEGLPVFYVNVETDEDVVIGQNAISHPLAAPTKTREMLHAHGFEVEAQQRPAARAIEPPRGVRRRAPAPEGHARRRRGGFDQPARDAGRVRDRRPTAAAGARAALPQRGRARLRQRRWAGGARLPGGGGPAGRRAAHQRRGDEPEDRPPRRHDTQRDRRGLPLSEYAASDRVRCRPMRPTATAPAAPASRSSPAASSATCAGASSVRGRARPPGHEPRLRRPQRALQFRRRRLAAAGAVVRPHGPMALQAAPPCARSGTRVPAGGAGRAG